MNRTQRARIRAMREGQNIAKSDRNKRITEGRIYSVCDTRYPTIQEKATRNMIRDYKCRINSAKETANA